jgi:hypothetical protein
VNNFKRFQDVADRCISVTDQMTQLAGGQTDSKKNSIRRRSNRRAIRNQWHPTNAGSASTPRRYSSY